MNIKVIHLSIFVAGIFLVQDIEACLVHGAISTVQKHLTAVGISPLFTFLQLFHFKILAAERARCALILEILQIVEELLLLHLHWVGIHPFDGI